MAKSGSRYFFLTAMILFCIGIALWLLSRRDGLSPKASVTFRGFGIATNWPDTPAAVLLDITNHAPLGVSFNANVLIRLKGRRLVDSRLVGGDLEPSQSFTMIVPLPNTNEGWAVVLSFQERTNGIVRVKERTHELYEKITGKAVPVRYSGRQYYVTNDINP